MKSPLFITIFLAAFWCNLCAQQNFRFADSTAQWNELYFNYGFGLYEIFNTVVYKADRDTIINNTNYQKITSADSVKTYFLRQDSAKSVYIRRYRDSIDYKIYDFGKNAGDTFRIKDAEYYFNDIHVKIDSTDTVMLGAKLRKRLYVSVSGWSPDIWIEGIGSLNTHLWSPSVQLDWVDGEGRNLLCYFENDSLLFHNNKWPDTCHIHRVTSINEIAKSDFKIYPNPVTQNYITIESENLHDNATFQLFDLTGRLLLQQQLTGKITSIILHKLSKGMYQCSVTSNQTIVRLSKLIVQ